MLDDILETSLAQNLRHGITGVLCHGNGVFLQALEGDREAVSRLYLSIGRDKRHHDVVLLHYEEIAERAFAGWSMGRVNAEQDQRRHAAALLGERRTGPLPDARRVLAGAAEGVDRGRSHRRPRRRNAGGTHLASVRPLAFRHPGCLITHSSRRQTETWPNRPHSRSLSNSSTHTLPGLAS